MFLEKRFVWGKENMSLEKRINVGKCLFGKENVSIWKRECVYLGYPTQKFPTLFFPLIKIIYKYTTF